MPNIAICEDDLATSRYIEGLVRAYQKQRPGQIDQVAVFLSSAQLLEQAAKDKKQFDIYLLDVLMPGARPSAGFPPATDADPAPEESCARENGLTLGELQRGAKNVLRLALASGANPFH